MNNTLTLGQGCDKYGQPSGVYTKDLAGGHVDLSYHVRAWTLPTPSPGALLDVLQSARANGPGWSIMHGVPPEEGAVMARRDLADAKWTVLVLDIDGTVDDALAPDASGVEVVQALPYRWLRDASWVFQRTGSSLVPGKGMRGRLWALLDAPLASLPIKHAAARWASMCPLLLDGVIYSKGLLFTADPVGADPVAAAGLDRFELVEGHTPMVDASLVKASGDETKRAWAATTTHPVTSSGRVCSYIKAIWPMILADLEDTASGERTVVLRAKATRLALLANAAGVARGPLLAALLAHVRVVWPTSKPKDRLIQWCVDNVDGVAYPPRRANLPQETEET